MTIVKLMTHCSRPIEFHQLANRFSQKRAHDFSSWLSLSSRMMIRDIPLTLPASVGRARRGDPDRERL